MVRGDYQVRIRGELRSGRAGSCFVYPAGEEHEPQYRIGPALELLVLQWTQPGADPLLDRPLAVLDPGARLLVLLEWLRDQWSGAEAGSGASAGTVETLFGALRHGLEVAAPTSDPAIEPDPVRRIRRYVRANLGGDCSLVRLAQIAALSRFHLLRCFRRSTGQTPHGYVREERLAAARRLLASRQLTLKEVARRVGIADPAYLGRLLRGGRKVGDHAGPGGRARAAACPGGGTDGSAPAGPAAALVQDHAGAAAPGAPVWGDPDRPAHAGAEAAARR